MNLKLIVHILTVVLFLGISYSCKEHKCRCEIPGEPTQITSTKRNKNDAKAECDEITAIAEEAGGYCTFYSE